MNNAKNMEEAAKSNDFMELSIAGITLMDNLHDLWKLRKVREEEWQAILNFLQSALVQEEFEKYTLNQCVVIRKTIENYLSKGSVNDTEIERAVTILREGGFDPFRGISKTNKNQ